MRHPTRWACFLLLTCSAFCADWNPSLAAHYLDSREKTWFAWPRANTTGVPCLSCHTTLPYALARPALRKALGESARTSYESGLLDGVRSALHKPNTKTHQVVLGTLLLSLDAARGGTLSADAEDAFTRLWSLQLQTGEWKGSWEWVDANLDPWEMPESRFYGATLAALAAGFAPDGYQERAGIRDHISLLKAFLCGAQKTQPLHNRLSLAWASAKLRGLLSEAEQREILDEALRRQQSDGGWTLESLGAWKPHPEGPAARDTSNGYATAVVSFLLEQGGISHSDAHLVKALGWLRAHQDPESGTWAAASMNHRYEAGSIPLDFMRDAATGYAALALLEGQ